MIEEILNVRIDISKQINPKFKALPKRWRVEEFLQRIPCRTCCRNGGAFISGSPQHSYVLSEMIASEAGAFSVGQDRENCVVYGMLKVAYEIGAVTQQLPIGRIADVLIRRKGETDIVGRWHFVKACFNRHDTRTEKTAPLPGFDALGK